MPKPDSPNQPHVVIVGGGFGGLYAARALRTAPVRITLVDRRNFHLFQPLLYQVATGGLSPGDIASPLRAILKRQSNLRVIQAEAVDLDPTAQKVILADGELGYDFLVLAAGAENHYFGHTGWERQAPGLKTVEDALEIRRRVLLAFEAAEREPDPVRRAAWTTLVVIGGGPTGVELAGALAELAHVTLRGEFRNFDPRQAQVILLEGQGRLLPQYPPEVAAQAQRALRRLGVTVLTGALVEDIQPEWLTYRGADGGIERIHARTVLWAAGMRASPLARSLKERAGAELDRSGRVIVDQRLALPNYPNIHVIGDMAYFSPPEGGGEPLPGVAPVAMQQGRYVARLIEAKLRGKSLPGFVYRDKGNLAVIGRNAAVAVFGGLRPAQAGLRPAQAGLRPAGAGLRLHGFPAWLAWVFVHIWYLIEFDNKLLVLFQWAWNYFTRKRGARLITGGDWAPAASDLEPAVPIPMEMLPAAGGKPAPPGR